MLICPMQIASFIAMLAASAALWACGDRGYSQPPPTIETRATIMPSEVTIKLGEMGQSLAQRYPDNVKIQHQPAGLDFYELDWEHSRGTVRIDHGRHSLVIEDVLGVMSSQDLEEFKLEGLKAFYISAGITAPDLIAHDEARLKTYAILRRILDAGWKQVIERSEPRLKGKARQDYTLSTSNLNGLDATYLPTFEEWMLIQSRTPWSFYANGLYMEINFTRERTLTDPKKPGSYLLTFNIKTETEYFRGYAGPDNRSRWKEAVPQELVKVAAQRTRKESELRAKGVAIDETYQDPPIPNMK